MMTVPSHRSDAAALPPCSLIIASRNRPQLLLDTVESILCGDEAPTELIVIDQSDAPNEALAARTTDRLCTIRYIWSRERGTSRARNDGIRVAQHDVLVFTDDDMLAHPAWLATLVRALVSEGRRSAVTGQVPSAGNSPGTFIPSITTHVAPVTYKGRVGRDVLFSGNMAVYRSAANEVGPFDERLGPGTPFPAAEDNDLGFRLLEAGYRILYVPDAILYHRSWRSERDYLPLRWRYARGQGAYFAKHIRARDHYMLQRLLGSARVHFVSCGRQMRHGPRVAAADAVYVLGLLLGAGQWLLTERGSRRPLALPTRGHIE